MASPIVRFPRPSPPACARETRYGGRVFKLGIAALPVSWAKRSPPTGWVCRGYSGRSCLSGHTRPVERSEIPFGQSSRRAQRVLDSGTRNRGRQMGDVQFPASSTTDMMAISGVDACEALAPAAGAVTTDPPQSPDATAKIFACGVGRACPCPMGSPPVMAKAVSIERAAAARPPGGKVCLRRGAKNRAPHA